MPSERTRWYLAGNGKINNNKVKLPPILIQPDQSDRDIVTDEAVVDPLFRESDDLYWHYDTFSGVIVISYPRLEESKENPRGEEEYNLEPNLYEAVGQGGYVVNPTPGENEIHSWIANLPGQFFPSEYEGNTARGQTPVDEKAALQNGTRVLAVFKEGMETGRIRSCYLFRRHRIVQEFYSSIDEEDDIVFIDSGFEDGDIEDLQNDIERSLQNILGDGVPRFG